MTALSYCADLVRRHDRDRFLAGLFAPAERREDLFALYAFNLEIARTREAVSEPMLGEIRLQWWRDTLEQLYEGRPRRHQVADALMGAIQRRGLDRRRLLRLIDAREADLRDAPPATLIALKRYAEESSTNLFLLGLEVLEANRGEAHLAAKHLGIAWALIGLLRAVPFHAAERRLYLPADLMDKAGVRPSDLYAGRGGAALNRVVAEIAAVAREHLGHARDRSGVKRAALPVLLTARIADLRLAQQARAGYDPFAPGFQREPLLLPARLWLAHRQGRF